MRVVAGSSRCQGWEVTLQTEVSGGLGGGAPQPPEARKFCDFEVAQKRDLLRNEALNTLLSKARHQHDKHRLARDNTHVDNDHAKITDTKMAFCSRTSVSASWLKQFEDMPICCQGARTPSLPLPPPMNCTVCQL